MFLMCDIKILQFNLARIFQKQAPRLQQFKTKLAFIHCLGVL